MRDCLNQNTKETVIMDKKRSLFFLNCFCKNHRSLVKKKKHANSHYVLNYIFIYLIITIQLPVVIASSLLA